MIHPRGTVVLSATTHLALEQVGLADMHLQIDDALRESSWVDCRNGLMLITGKHHDDSLRTAGLASDQINWIHDALRDRDISLLIEADGSRCLPLKAPFSHEPVIPSWVDAVMVVAGLSGLGKPLSRDWVYNPDEFGRLAGMTLGEPVAAEHLAAVLIHREGGLKCIPPSAKRIVLLNQVNSPERLAVSMQIAHLCLQVYDAVVVADLKLEPGDNKLSSPVIAVHEPVSAVVLAAGRSRRMGQPKLVMPWGDETVIGHVVETLIMARIKDVVVVSGGASEEINQSLSGKPVRIIHNPEFSDREMLASFQLGLSEVGEKSQAALVVLGDQPQMQVRTIEAIMDAYRSSRPAIVVPSFQNRRGHPWLVDRSLWSSLLGLESDETLRNFLDEHRSEIEYIDSPDDTILRDLDTPADYLREINENR